jgi:hypothetical protein
LEVPPRSVPDLIGTGGSVVKALRDACGVHVNFPTQVWRLQLLFQVVTDDCITTLAGQPFF